MSEKSRVILYENLRKQIAAMEDYSFEERKKKRLEEKKNLESISDVDNESIQKSKEEMKINGIKKNTLSMSIDELIDEQIAIESQSQKEQAKKEFKKKTHKNGKLLNIITWVICGVILLVFIVLIVVLLIR